MKHSMYFKQTIFTILLLLSMTIVSANFGTHETLKTDIIEKKTDANSEITVTDPVTIVPTVNPSNRVEIGRSAGSAIATTGTISAGRISTNGITSSGDITVDLGSDICIDPIDGGFCMTDLLGGSGQWSTVTGGIRTDESVGIQKDPTSALDVAGTVKATTFDGDGSQLDNVVATGMHTRTGISSVKTDTQYITFTTEGGDVMEVRKVGGSSTGSVTIYGEADADKIVADEICIGSTCHTSWPTSSGSSSSSVWTSSGGTVSPVVSTDVITGEDAIIGEIRSDKVLTPTVEGRFGPLLLNAIQDITIDGSQNIEIEANKAINIYSNREVYGGPSNTIKISAAHSPNTQNTMHFLTDGRVVLGNTYAVRGGMFAVQGNIDIQGSDGGGYYGITFADGTRQTTAGGDVDRLKTPDRTKTVVRTWNDEKVTINSQYTPDEDFTLGKGSDSTATMRLLGPASKIQFADDTMGSSTGDVNWEVESNRNLLRINRVTTATNSPVLEINSGKTVTMKGASGTQLDVQGKLKAQSLQIGSSSTAGYILRARDNQGNVEWASASSSGSGFSYWQTQPSGVDTLNPGTRRVAIGTYAGGNGMLTVDGSAWNPTSTHFGSIFVMAPPDPYPSLLIKGTNKAIIDSGYTQHSTYNANTPNGLWLNYNTNKKVILAHGGGNVGIGSFTDTENPSSKLTVKGDITSTTKVTTPELCIGSTCKSVWPGGQWEPSGTATYYNRGNVGVLKAAPLTPLHVKGKMRTEATGSVQYAEMYHDGSNARVESSYGNIVTSDVLRADGGLNVGDDEGFYRSAEDVITTDDTFVVKGGLTLDGLGSKFFGAHFPRQPNTYYNPPGTDGFLLIALSVTGCENRDCWGRARVYSPYSTGNENTETALRGAASVRISSGQWLNPYSSTIVPIRGTDSYQVVYSEATSSGSRLPDLKIYWIPLGG